MQARGRGWGNRRAGSESATTGIDIAMVPFPSFLEFLERKVVGGTSFRNPADVDESKLMPGLGKAVNPARPASPLNSRLLASPFRKRFSSQVVGK